ncbi:MAG: hypothetical protein OXH59_06835 [Rhodospirillaceae bacterium]|nr:hypothetical protein [Rhodospirillaceae bacterium]
MTSKKTEPKPQRDRFIETARELGCDEDEGRFNETLKRVAKAPSKEKPRKEERPSSLELV